MQQNQVKAEMEFHGWLVLSEEHLRCATRSGSADLADMQQDAVKVGHGDVIG